MKILIAIIVVAIIIAMVVLGVNLYMTIDNLQMSPIIQLSNTALTIETDTWALRGQIGDILSGHFSALAFLAVALSIILQNQANKQMRESIDKQEKALEQQNKALSIQSKGLKAQIKELKTSRIESSKQTEEFYIQNMNVKLDRYYKLLELSLEPLDESFWINYNSCIQTENAGKMNQNWEKSKLEYELKLDRALLSIDLIFSEIEAIKDLYSLAYNGFKKEFSIRLTTSSECYQLKNKYAFASSNQALMEAFSSFSESP